MNITPKLEIKPSPIDQRDWFVSTIYNNIIIPNQLDYSKNLNPVRDQGSQGSCAAHSAACMKEWQEKKDIGFHGLMSPQFIYNNRENQDSEGMYCRDVMKILSKKGCCFENDYPYGIIQNPLEIDEKIMTKAKNFKIKNYAQINTISELKKALYLNGPCLVAFPTYNYSTRMWMPLLGNKLIGGHAMTIVGYDNHGFIIRNSWGNSWGINGNCIYPYSDWGSHWEIWTTIDDKSFYVDTQIKKEINPSDLKKYSNNYFVDKKNKELFMEISDNAETIYLNNFIYKWNKNLNFWQDIDHQMYFITLSINLDQIIINEYYDNYLIESFIFSLNNLDNFDQNDDLYLEDEEEDNFDQNDDLDLEEEDLDEQEDQDEEEENLDLEEKNLTCFDKLKKIFGIK